MLTSVDYPMYINPFSLWLNAIFYSSSDLSDQEIAKVFLKVKRNPAISNVKERCRLG